MNIVDIKEWLGHSDLQMTLRYLNARPNKLRNAAAVIDYESGEEEQFNGSDQPTASNLVYNF